MCRIAPHLGTRVGGQGAVVFAQHVNSPSLLYALKFFLQDDVFSVEKAAACNDVRSVCQSETRKQLCHGFVLGLCRGVGFGVAYILA